MHYFPQSLLHPEKKIVVGYWFCLLGFVWFWYPSLVMDLVTVQNVFVSWSPALVWDSVSGFGFLVYLETCTLLFYFFFFFFPCSLEPVVYWFKTVSEYQEWNAHLAIVTDKAIPATSFQSLPCLPFFPYEHPGAPWAAQQVPAAGALSAQEIPELSSAARQRSLQQKLALCLSFNSVMY